LESTNVVRLDEHHETARLEESTVGFIREFSKRTEEKPESVTKKVIKDDEAEGEMHEEWTEHEHFGFEERRRLQIIGNCIILVNCNVKYV